VHPLELRDRRPPLDLIAGEARESLLPLRIASRRVKLGEPPVR